MASSTPFTPNISSRGAADTTAGRTYFSTPSAQVRVPVGDLVSPHPHFRSHYTTWGKTIRERQWKGAEGVWEAGCGKVIRRRKNLSGGGIIIRWRNNYPGRRRWAKKSKKDPKTVAQCRKYPNPYLYT